MVVYEESEDIFAASSHGARNSVDTRQRYARRLALMGEEIPERIRGRGDLAPFIGWDGEGVTDSEGHHHYILFGSSSGGRVASESLGTKECLDLLLREGDSNPHAIHVIFAGNYDVNMILKDVNVKALKRLKEHNVCYWYGYRIEYLKSKFFKVKKGDSSVTLWDVFTFFSTSFVKAVKEYLGEDWSDLALIEKGKAKRHDFVNADINKDIIPYWLAELRTLVDLCNALRTNLTSAGIVIRRWHGPGSVASAVLRARGFRRTVCPDEVNVAAQYAYAGGRFEAFKVGTHHGDVYQYDIRSAYPFAITQLPRLGGAWKLSSGRGPIRDFGVYRVSFKAVDALPSVPFPLHWRLRDGRVFYPPTVGMGWYWGPEVRNLVRYWKGQYVIHEAWIYDDNGDRPFSWVSDMYDQRAKWKDEGNPSQLALKLALNSMYGKMAQQVGARVDAQGNWKLPAYHQLEFAGWTTSKARALLYEAIMLAGDNAIAVETDAIFSTVPLRLDCGSGLGQWDESRYNGITYVQSGVYFVKRGDEWVGKYRGFNKPCRPNCSDHDTCIGALRYEPIREYLARIKDAADAYDDPGITTSLTRFKTLGSSIGKDYWRHWVTEPRTIRAGLPGGKREHYAALCWQCRRGVGSLADHLHTMVPAVSLNGVDFSQESTKYPLEWKGDPPSEYVPDVIHDEDVWEVGE